MDLFQLNTYYSVACVSKELNRMTEPSPSNFIFLSPLHTFTAQTMSEFLRFLRLEKRVSGLHS